MLRVWLYTHEQDWTLNLSCTHKINPYIHWISSIYNRGSYRGKKYVRQYIYIGDIQCIWEFFSRVRHDFFFTSANYSTRELPKCHIERQKECIFYLLHFLRFCLICLIQTWAHACMQYLSRSSISHWWK